MEKKSHHNMKKVYIKAKSLTRLRYSLPNFGVMRLFLSSNFQARIIPEITGHSLEILDIAGYLSRE